MSLWDSCSLFLGLDLNTRNTNTLTIHRIYRRLWGEGYIAGESSLEEWLKAKEREYRLSEEYIFDQIHLREKRSRDQIKGVAQVWDRLLQGTHFRM
jgi:hypothetical protein